MKLKKFTVTQGGKFDGEAPIVIDFSSSKSGLVGLVGDEQLGKSTIISLFEMVVGNLGGEKAIEMLKNAETGKIEAELEFVGNDRQTYVSRRTASELRVTCNGEKKGSPTDILRKMLGAVAANPLKIKNSSVEDIVKWLASLSKTDPKEFEAKMLKFKDGQKKAKNARAAANKEAKTRKGILVNAGFMTEKGDLIERTWVESEKRFAKKPDTEEIAKRLDKAGKDSDQYLRAEEKLKNVKISRNKIAEDIEKLKQELAQKEKDLKAADKSITDGEKFLTDNKSFKTEYDKVKSEYEGVAQSLVAYNQWQQILIAKRELDEYETASQKADNLEKDLLKQQQELQWEVIPDTKDTELLLEDTHEDDGPVRKAGLYHKKMHNTQQSVSEFIGVVVRILKKQGVPILLLDGVGDFGSTLWKLLEGYAKEATILYAKTEVGATELTIEYK